MLYQTLDFTLDVNSLTITKSNGEVIKLRPKTCQLLIVLLSNAQSSVSKGQLLNDVWAGTVVAEQVIFQSINEIRKLFPNQEVIKTIPKEGYVWIPEVKMLDEQATLNNEKPRVGSKVYVFAVALLTVILVLLNFKSELESVSGSIVILPIQNDIPGNDHSWVRMGVMDQLIQSLPNNEHNVILQTDYVLEVLDRAGVDYKNILLEDLARVFTVSGAELIVSSTLTGSPHEYELSYVFHYRNARHKGALFSRDIQSLVDELTHIISARIGNELLLSSESYHADFNEQILGQAIEFRLARKYDEAATLLESIVIGDPSNLTAQRLLIDTYFALRQVEKVAERISIALPIAERSQDKDELVRIMYFNAIHLFLTDQKVQARETAENALVIAQQNNDWLYMAYIKGVQAEMAISEERYSDAETLFLEAKEHHKVLHCPLGESNSWGNLAKLAKKQGRKDKFDEAMANAKRVAKSRDLKENLEWLNSIEF